MLERKEIKKKAAIEFSQNIENQTIELSLSDYYNVLEEENEIVLNGQYFDITRKEIVNDRIILTGHHDELETELINWFEGLPHKKDIQINIFNFLNSLFIVENCSYSFGFLDKITQSYSYHLTQYLSPLFISDHPPQ